MHIMMWVFQHLVGTIPLNQQCGPTDRCEDPHADCMGTSGSSVTLCLCVDTHFEKARSGFCSTLISHFSSLIAQTSE